MGRWDKNRTKEQEKFRTKIKVVLALSLITAGLVFVGFLAQVTNEIGGKFNP